MDGGEGSGGQEDSEKLADVAQVVAYSQSSKIQEESDGDGYSKVSEGVPGVPSELREAQTKQNARELQLLCADAHQSE